jgi:glycosyltransferase involved in cell wall biosynthesis
MTSPRVTVLTSIYNGEKYLREALDSILNQTFKDFEFLIINDCSTDKTAEILESYRDPRIRIVNNEENMGLTKSLNKGLKLANSEYIARMDADDISLPERLQKQVEFLDEHPEIGVLGTWIQWIDENSKPSIIIRPPTAPGVIGWFLIFENCVAHPSVMMRADVIIQLGFYNAEAIHAQDYDLWVRANFITRIANIPDTLVQLRVWEGSISSRQAQTQEMIAINTMHEMIRRVLGSEVPLETVADLRKSGIGSLSVSSKRIGAVSSLIEQLHQVYLRQNSLNHTEALEVAQDTGRRLYSLAISAGRISKREGLTIFIKAARFNPDLLFTLFRQLIQKVKNTLLRRK